MESVLATMPLVRNGSKDSKSLILGVLSKERELSARQVYQKCSSAVASGSLSYSGIHKALGEMADGGVLKKSGSSYSFSSSWVGELNDFAGKLRLAQSGVCEGTFSFSTPYEADVFLMKLFNDKPVAGRPKLFIHWRHFWIPLFLDQHKYLDAHAIAGKYAVYTSCFFDTPVDVWCADFWRKHGMKPCVGVANIAGEIVACDGVMTQTIYPKEFIRQVDFVYSKAGSVDSINLKAFFKDNFSAPGKTFVRVTQNEELCARLQEELSINFNGKHKNGGKRK